MNNSFPRLIDGICATLRKEVLPRLDDDFSRGQVYGVINLLNTFKVRADWSAGFLLQQIEAQQRALAGAAELATASSTTLPALPDAAPQPSVPIAELLARRDANNRAIGALIGWLDAESTALPAGTAARIERLLRDAMRAEVDIEMKASPRPLFAEMSSGREGERR